jgi:hypothetical protein
MLALSLTRGLVCKLFIQLLLGACQSSHSWAAVPQNSRPYFTVSFGTPPTWRARFLYLYPPGTEWPSYTPEHWIPICRLLRLAGLRWRYSNPPPHGYIWRICFALFILTCHSVPTSQETLWFSITTINWSRLFDEYSLFIVRITIST